MNINGVELQDLDFMDLEVAEKFEKCLIETEKVSRELQKNSNLTMSQNIRTQCTTVFNVFNTMFGEGTDKKIFGDKVNLMTCLKAFNQLVEYSKQPNEELVELTKKYSPNRASRRKKK